MYTRVLFPIGTQQTNPDGQLCITLDAICTTTKETHSIMHPLCIMNYNDFSIDKKTQIKEYITTMLMKKTIELRIQGSVPYRLFKNDSTQMIELLLYEPSSSSSHTLIMPYEDMFLKYNLDQYRWYYRNNQPMCLIDLSTSQPPYYHSTATRQKNWIWSNVIDRIYHEQGWYSNVIYHNNNNSFYYSSIQNIQLINQYDTYITPYVTFIYSATECRVRCFIQLRDKPIKPIRFRITQSFTCTNLTINQTKESNKVKQFIRFYLGIQHIPYLSIS